MASQCVKPMLGTSLGRGTPLTRGLVAYWDFTALLSNNQTAIPEATGRFPLTLVTSADNPDRVPTVWGPALGCGHNGVRSQRLTHTRPPELTSVAGFSLVCRMRIPAGFTGAAIGQWGQGPSQQMVRILTSDVLWHVRDAANVNEDAVTYAPSLIHDRWAHCAWVADGGMLRAYVDGSLRASQTLVGPYLAPCPNPLWRVGDAYNTTCAAQVLFERISYYARALTSHEVRQLAYQPDLVYDARPTMLPPASAPAGASGGTDWDVIEDVQARLRATNEFDAVYDEMPELRGRSSGERSVAVVLFRDVTEVDEFNDSAGARSIARGRFTVRLLARDDDPEMRWANLCRRGAVAMNVINGQALANLTFPALTRLRFGRVETRTPPEQALVLDGEYVYQVLGHASHDASAPW